MPAATLAIALGDVRVRDRAVCLAAHGDTGAYLNLWADLARRVDTDYRVPVMVLVAFTAWRDGGGPLPSIAIDVLRHVLRRLALQVRHLGGIC